MSEAADQFREAEAIVWTRMQDYQRKAIEEARKDPKRNDDIAMRFAREISILVDCDLNTKAERYQLYVKSQMSRWFMGKSWKDRPDKNYKWQKHHKKEKLRNTKNHISVRFERDTKRMEYWQDSLT